jgi:hypothetical protein
MFMRKALVCSFCGKSAAQVEKLVAGPQVFICNDCVATASCIMREPGGTAPPARTHVSPTFCRWLARRMPWPRVSRHERSGLSAVLGQCVHECGRLTTRWGAHVAVSFGKGMAVSMIESPCLWAPWA